MSKVSVKDSKAKLLHCFNMNRAASDGRAEHARQSAGHMGYTWSNNRHVRKAKMGFGNLKSDSGLQALNNYLTERSYIEVCFLLLPSLWFCFQSVPCASSGTFHCKPMLLCLEQ